MTSSKEKLINIDFTEDELWNAYICLHNLTTKPRENFYDPEIRAPMVQIRDRLYSFGKINFGWVGIK